MLANSLVTVNCHYRNAAILNLKGKRSVIRPAVNWGSTAFPGCALSMQFVFTRGRTAFQAVLRVGPFSSVLLAGNGFNRWLN